MSDEPTHAEFVDALRSVLGLASLYTPGDKDGRVQRNGIQLQSGGRFRVHRERPFDVATPRRGPSM